MAKMSEIVTNYLKSWAKHLDLATKELFENVLVPEILKGYQQQRFLPTFNNVFKVFQACPLEKVKVLILGQDPYPAPQHAHGIAFSSLALKTPASLVNIKKSLQKQGFYLNSNNLSKWLEQGVFLLNVTLVVNKTIPHSASNNNWKTFTSAILKILNETKENLVFILWGQKAQAYAPLINSQKHLILKGVHPSPLSAYRGFFDFPWFLKTNQYLEKHNLKAIDWNID